MERTIPVLPREFADDVGQEDQLIAEQPAENKPPCPPKKTLANSARVTVRNNTVYRLSVAASPVNKCTYPFLLPPLGSRTIKKPLCKLFDFRPWEERNLITIEEVPPSVVTDLTTFKVFLNLLPITLITAWLLPPVRDNFWLLGIILGFLLLVTLLIDHLRAQKNGWPSLLEHCRRVAQWFSESLSLLIVVLIGLGIPILVIFFFGGGAKMLTWEAEKPPSLALLGRAVQGTFITIAALLPTLLYFLYGHQQLAALRDTFFREVMLLDPKVLTRDEAQSEYGHLVDEVYGSKEGGHIVFGTGLPVLVCTLLITLGWTLTLLPIGEVDKMQSNELYKLLLPQLTAVNFGFLGAYFFAVNMVFRRYVRADLTPKAYSHISMRILVTVILVWTMSVLAEVGGTGTKPNDGILLPMAFIIGIFPETGLTLIKDALKHVGGFIPSLRENHPLTKLEGINLYDQARLLEEGIESVENLAHHNLIELMLRTRIPTPRLVDLFDQAILYLHLGYDPVPHKVVRQTLRVYGIRTATDLVQAYKATKSAEKPALLALLETPGELTTKPLRLQVILNTLQDDEWMAYLLRWRELRSRTITSSTPENFYPTV